MWEEGGMGLHRSLDCGCGCGGLKQSDLVKFKFASYSAILFFVISNPYTYKATSSLLGKWVASGGCPSMLGVFLHTFVFLIISFLLMKVRT